MKKGFLKIISCVLSLLFFFSTIPCSIALAEEIDEFEALVEAFIERNKLTEKNFAYAYYNTVTEETHSFNKDRAMYAASVYKLPLALHFYDQIALGNIGSNERYAGYTISESLRLSLQYSDNTTSQAMRRAVGSYRDYRVAISKYTDVPVSELDSKSLSSHYFTVTEIMNTLKYLYKNADDYPDAIKHLKAANPGEYFKRYIKDYEIAQKYGYYTPNINTAGIIYTPTPYLLVVFTEGLSESIISRFNEMVCNYTVKKYKTYNPDTMTFVKPIVSPISVNGILMELESYKIGNSTFFRLRDLAYILNGTDKQFSVGYDSTTKSIVLRSRKPYTSPEIPIPYEGKKGFAEITKTKVFLDGTLLDIDLYTINSGTFVKIRDLTEALNINTAYSSSTGIIRLNTSKNYSD